MLYISLPSWLNYAVVCLLLPPSLHLGHLGSNQSNPDHFNMRRDTAHHPESLMSLSPVASGLSRGLHSLQGIWNPNRLPVTDLPTMDFTWSPITAVQKQPFVSHHQIWTREWRTKANQTHLSFTQRWVKSWIYFPDDWYVLKAFKMRLRWMLSLKQLEINDNGVIMSTK